MKRVSRTVPFREAVQGTRKKRLIVGACIAEICLAFAVAEALKNGYDVMFVTDAVGGTLASGAPDGY